MASNFVPLQPLAPAAAKTPAGMTPLKAAPTPPKDRPAAASTHFAPLCAATGTGAVEGAQPVVTLKKEGDRIVQIRIQCICGQIVELACDY